MGQTTVKAHVRQGRAVRAHTWRTDGTETELLA